MSVPAGQSAAQVAGWGAVLSIGGVTGASGTETFTPVGEVKDVKLSGRKTSTTMATHFGSLRTAQKIGTIIDLGTATFTANRVSNDPGQIAVNAAQLTLLPYDFKLVLPSNVLEGETTAGDTVLFSGIVTEAGSFSVELDKVSEYDFTVDLNSYSVTVGS